MTILIRPATDSDAGALARILGAWIDETPWMPRLHTLGEHAGFLRHLIASHEVVLAEDASGPIGFVAAGDGRIDALYVAASARRRGTGTALLDQVKRQGPLTLWTFQANHRAQAFYLRAGLVEVTRTDGTANDERLPDVQFMWKG